ncbi:hypothetical protein NEMBOFW57_003610 [Staphylotrichum longicolle]|uniref:Rhodopsin domain-containing protein n=1 Tax=Staphylotrichum longicolle TaxID=669026 RepID=A0AAD4F863_9PEZI|nr:hypothetical protein NEMBOFW57_003610 [Staphylotrichum longicolle]
MHLGHSVAAAMWAMTALSLGFVALRLYTRIHIVHFFGAEDYLYICTGVMLVAFTASIQVAVHYGLGTSFWTLSLDETSNAILWTYIANTFAVTGNAMAKLSLGVFLLRVVQMKAQKAALWVLNIVTAATSTALVIMVWNQTTPVKTSWDPLRTPGTWNIEIKPMGVGLGEVSVNDYTLNFAKYFAWAGAEIAVSMICLGLPTLRPLYVKGTGTTLYERGHTAQQGDPELAQFASKPASPTPPPPSARPERAAEDTQLLPQLGRHGRDAGDGDGYDRHAPDTAEQGGRSAGPGPKRGQFGRHFRAVCRAAEPRLAARGTRWREELRGGVEEPDE